MIGDMLYYIFCFILIAGILTGIYMMRNVKTAAWGNRLSSICMFFSIAVTLIKYEIISAIPLLLAMAAGLIIGVLWAKAAKMIAMPQMVALLNGLGGAASALVGIIILQKDFEGAFVSATAVLAVGVGLVTFFGSLVAACKLNARLPQKPIVLRFHQLITVLFLAVSIATVCLIAAGRFPLLINLMLCAVSSGLFGIFFAIRVGGADMPITISLLNSLSGVAGSIAGMSIGDPLLTAVGGIVGASGLLLTQVMCGAMNRSLPDIILGKTSVNNSDAAPVARQVQGGLNSVKEQKNKKADIAKLLSEANRVIIIPGYGMALAKAQQAVASLMIKLEARGANVDFAIHPVAGRMPGHMNVLLAEVNIPYEKLRELDDINEEFVNCDLVIIVGANDVVNPAARNAKGTPIYGMPVLAADNAKHIVICNYDLKPGYSGVENPLYDNEKVSLLLGDASKTVEELLKMTS